MKSPTTKPRAKQMYRDSRGIPFDEARFYLPDKQLRAKVFRVDDRRVCEFMHQRFLTCWKCGQGGWGIDKRVQAHHMFAGSAGRSDELCCIAMLCPLHHGQLSESILPLGELLYLKWRYDWLHVDWCRMTLLCGSYLPDLIVRRT